MSWPGLAERLEGRLVVLEPIAPDHEAGLAEAAADAGLFRWIDPPFSFEEAMRLTAAGEEQAFVTLAGGRVIGSTRYLTLRPLSQGLEIGWTWLVRDAWGTGANVEAKLLQLEHAFERLGCVRVEFKTHAENERSRAALAALPAQFEGIFRKHKPFRDGWRDSAYYSIVDDEWPRVRANLERRLGAKLGR
ncbi:MAG: GNAT family protein [Gaiellaceae bacterium]